MISRHTSHVFRSSRTSSISQQDPINAKLTSTTLSFGTTTIAHAKLELHRKGQFDHPQTQHCLRALLCTLQLPCIMDGGAQMPACEAAMQDDEVHLLQGDRAACLICVGTGLCFCISLCFRETSPFGISVFTGCDSCAFVGCPGAPFESLSACMLTVSISLTQLSLACSRRTLAFEQVAF